MTEDNPNLPAVRKPTRAEIAQAKALAKLQETERKDVEWATGGAWNTHPATVAGWKIRQFWQLDFLVPIPIADLTEALVRAMSVARTRGILGRRPTIIKPFHRIASTFKMIAVSRGFIDIMMGVLSGMGWIAQVTCKRRINEPDPMLEDGVGHVVEDDAPDLLQGTESITTDDEG